MAAMTERKFLALIKNRGFSVQMTKSGHFRLMDPKGKATAIVFAVGHGSNKGMVNAPYVKRVFLEILKWSPDE